MANKNTKELFIKAHNGDLKAREQLILQNINLVRKKAHYYRKTYNDFETLVQVGTIGLIKAVDGFEPDRGFKFSSYAVPLIDGYMRVFIRDYREDRPFRLKRAEYELYREILKARTKLSQEMQDEPTTHEIAARIKRDDNEVEIIINAIERSTSIYSTLYRSERSKDNILIIDSALEQDIQDEQIINKIMIEKALRVLTDKQRKVIHLRYFKEYSQAKVGQVLNISQAQISRIEKQALKMLKAVI